MTLWYLPIEPYDERYTRQLDDWVVLELEKREIDYVRVPGKTPYENVSQGQVLDAIGRPLWCFEQTKTLLQEMQKGTLQDGDKIFTMDIWQFGIETLFYAANQKNINLDFYGFNCAGSFEWYDFINLSGIGIWGKHLERCWFEQAKKVFFASEKLRDMAFRNQMFSDPRKAVITGLAFNSDYVLNEAGVMNNQKAFNYPDKTRTVVFPHRYDMEKNPDIYLDIIEKMKDDWINFVITSGRKDLFGTADYKRAKRLEKEGKLKIYSGLSKQDYYNLLLESSIVFSSAKQDTVGNCILESVTLGCTPVVNTGVSYEEFLPKKFIYTDGCVDEACELIRKYIDKPENAFSYIKRYDNSLGNMIKEMGY